MLAVVNGIAILFLFLFVRVLLASAPFGLVRCLLPLCLDALRIILCISYQTERILVFKTNMATVTLASSVVCSVIDSLRGLYILLCGFEGCGIRVKDGLALC